MLMNFRVGIRCIQIDVIIDSFVTSVSKFTHVLRWHSKICS